MNEKTRYFVLRKKAVPEVLLKVVEAKRLLESGKVTSVQDDRSEKFNLFEHIGENKNFVLVMGAIFVLQTIIIEIGGKVFNTTLLEPKALLVSMVLAVLIIPVDLIRKAIMSR